jgi:hypothetical protein
MSSALITDRAEYWDHYANGVANETPEEAIKNAFGWTQYEDHGPGDEILGEPLSALELGSGRGNAVAALASKGIDGGVSGKRRHRLGCGLLDLGGRCGLPILSGCCR